MDSEELDGKVIEDERTGEIIPKGANTKIVTSNLQVVVEAKTIGTLELDEKTLAVLDERLNPLDIRIRPDGLVYLPWTYWAEKLNRAFGRLRWGMIPQGAPQSKDTGKDTVLVVWGFWLIVKGIPVSFAMGETSYKTNNKTMSFADAVEGAKSISLARNCKLLGMALELWDAEWVDSWKKEYAKYIKNPREGGYPDHIWVRNDDTRYTEVKKPAQKQPKPKVKEEEVPPHGQPPVDEAFPKGNPQEAEYSVADLRKIHNVEAIKACGADLPTILGAINQLPQDKKYTIDYVKNLITGAKQDG